MKKQDIIDIVCAIVVLVALAIIITDPFGIGTAKQYGVNAICLFSIAFAIAKSSLIQRLHPEDFS